MSEPRVLRRGRDGRPKKVSNPETGRTLEWVVSQAPRRCDGPGCERPIDGPYLRVAAPFRRGMRSSWDYHAPCVPEELDPALSLFFREGSRAYS